MISVNNIVEDAGQYVFDLFKEKLSNYYVYHNYQHTLETVNACKKLAQESSLNEEDLEVLLLSAWFHDTGYIYQYNGHEDKSMEIAAGFLNQLEFPKDKIKRVLNCIESTKRKSVPGEFICQILCDADLISIGDESFFQKAELLRAEWENFNIRICDEQEWAQTQLDFLRHAHFHTAIAEKKYGNQHALNIEEQRKKLKKIIKKKDKQKKQKDESKAQLKRGIETMFRSLYRSHINLSSIADSKANMMISINSVIISITLTLVGAKLSIFGTSFKENQIVIYPVMSLLLTSLISIIFGILSAKPKVTGETSSPEEASKKKFSVLFFGNFTNMTVDRFEYEIRQLMKDENKLYGSMIDDLYYLGKVLTQKYKLLKYSYISFMIGLIITVFLILFVIIFLKKTDDM